MSRLRRRRGRRCARPRRRIVGLPVQVEVDRIDQIEPALDAGADRLLLDNMDAATLRQAVALVAGRVPLEASGGVNLDTIRGDRRNRRRLYFGRPHHAVGAGGRYRPRLRLQRVPIGLRHNMIYFASSERCGII